MPPALLHTSRNALQELRTTIAWLEDRTSGSVLNRTAVVKIFEYTVQDCRLLELLLGPDYILDHFVFSYAQRVLYSTFTSACTVGNFSVALP